MILLVLGGKVGNLERRVDYFSLDFGLDTVGIGTLDAALQLNTVGPKRGSK